MTAARAALAPLLVLAVLLAAMLYAAFAEGAVGLPEETWVQLALLACAVAVAAALLYGTALRARAATPAWVGVGLLVAFAFWSGVTILWSVAPDRSWLELNRGLLYALGALLGIVVGSSLPRAAERTVEGYVAVASLVALYALGGKTLPGLHVGGLVDLDHAGGVSRLRAPLEYWNALALACVLAVPGALRLAAAPDNSPRLRLAGAGALYLLLVVVGLTYSRGGILALLAGVAVLVALTRERAATAAVALLAAVAAGMPLALAFTSDDLTTNGIPLGRREGDAALVLLAFVAGAALLLAALWGLRRFEHARPRVAERGLRGARTAAGALAVFAITSALATGGASQLADDFTATPRNDTTDPQRLLSANSANRWAWWKEAAGAWSDKPLQGWGAGSFPVTHRLYRRDELSVREPHSVPLQWLAETGLVGALLAAGGMLALLAAALARVRSLPDGPQRGFAAALVAAAVAWGVHACLDWDWDIPAVTLPALVFLGVACGRPWRGVAAAPAPWRGQGAALVVATVLLVLAAVSAALPALSQDRTDAALARADDRGLSADELRDTLATAELGARLNPLAVRPLFAAASLAERRGSLDEARRQLLRAIDRQPYSAEAWGRLVRVEFARRDRAGTLLAARRWLALDPRNRAAYGLTVRAAAALAPPEESATATGTPLPAATAPLAP